MNGLLCEAITRTEAAEAAEAADDEAAGAAEAACGDSAAAKAIERARIVGFMAVIRAGRAGIGMLTSGGGWRSGARADDREDISETSFHQCLSLESFRLLAGWQ
ncbi:hypothetical protein GCM10009733_042330 [Nonomuraea maheshkhaliensis]|uniref:Uncharacterized protein n=1 Tax=Nonomuraea maheshkhaliensis TaxID=419590 RepID=A0ABP4R8G0_9ACTN